MRIGRALAMALAADGFFVFVHYNRSAAEARADGGRYRGGRRQGQGGARRSRLGQAGRGAGRHAAGRRGVRLTCLVNNASLFKLDRAPTATAADFDLHMAINLRAPLLLVAGAGAAAARRRDRR